MTCVSVERDHSFTLRETTTRAVYTCECGNGFVADRDVRGDFIKPAPAVEGKTCGTCWKCGKAEGTHLMPHHLRHHATDARLLCKGCWDLADKLWLLEYERDRIADSAREDLDRPVGRRVKVYQPEMVGTGGFNPFDPSRRR